MKRRTFLQSLAVASGAGLVRAPRAQAALPKAKITRVRIYEPPNINRLFNQSTMIVTVETDIGVTGLGEGGSKDTLEFCAGAMIGMNPFQTEMIWQQMFIASFYPPGRERIHAQGALDMALWDIKGKVLNLPVHQILGGTARNYVECYSTGNVRLTGEAPADPYDRIRKIAEATMAAGYRAYRMDASIGGPLENNVFNARERVHHVAQSCKAAREGVGPKGEFTIDFHQKFDYINALRCLQLIEEYEPYLVEDPVRDEHALEDIPKLRPLTSCPLSHGEEWGHRWDFNKLIENHDIDYARATLSNVGGITEMMKIAALCETHTVGIVPHFTGPISTAAQVNCLSTFTGPLMMEYNYGDRPLEHLPQCLDFKAGKLYTNERPGLGVTAEMKLLKQVGEVTAPGRRSLYSRPDGSLTHW